jgi:uncharacterized membrane protein
MQGESAKEPVKKRRRLELDFLRGIALIVMTTGHPLRADVYGNAAHGDFIRILYNHYGELFSGLFMFVSGINVTNFLASARKTADFDATKFYVKSAVALFVLGWTYNLCVGTALFIDIIQAIALGTLVTYLLLERRVPSWGMALFTAVLFIAAPVILGNGPVDDSTMARVSSYRYFVAFFGPVPWLGFFTFGVLVDRVKDKRTQNILLAVCAALFVFSHFLPQLRGTAPAVYLLKANLRYMVMSVGMIPLLFILCGRLYQGRSRLGREIEYWGNESLVFLVFHWFYIFYLGLIFQPIYNRFGETFTVWLTSACTMAIMAGTVRPLARLRDRWSTSPAFYRRAWIFFGLSMFLWSVFMGNLIKIAAKSGIAVPDLQVQASWTPIYMNFFLKQNFAFFAAMTFCFIYPELRKRLRLAAVRKRGGEGASGT